jgi:4-hydroxybenzoyl-CoA reductase subunit beta
MNLPHFTYHAPATLEECTGLLANLGDKAQILAGGSDLLVRMKFRLTRPGHLVSLSKIAELKHIVYSPGKGLTIGAGTTLSVLASDSIVREQCPALATTGELVATKQIRNTATLGGNVFQNTRCQYYNRSPVWGKAVAPCFKRNGTLCHVVPKGKRCFAVYQGDMAPILIALNATAMIVSKNSGKEMHVETLFSGDGKEPCKDRTGMLITHFTIPENSLRMHSAYRKYRLRNGIDFPLAGVAVVVENKNDLIGNLRICLTGTASSPVLIPGTGEMARGKPLSKELAREAGKMAQAAAHPLANLEDEPARRRFMIRIMTEDILTSFVS